MLIGLKDTATQGNVNMEFLLFLRYRKRNVSIIIVEGGLILSGELAAFLTSLKAAVYQ